MDPRVYQLLNNLIEQRLDAEQSAELTELLRTDAEVVRAYVRLMGIHMDLMEIEAPVRAFSIDELRTIKAVEDQCQSEQCDQVAPPGKDKSQAGSSVLAKAALVMATVAVLLLVLFLVFLQSGPFLGQSSSLSSFNVSRGADRADETPSITPGENQLVARIIKKVDCDWEEDRWSVTPSSNIAAGQHIHLSRGLLVLRFDCGVELALNGPASLIAVSDHSAQLLQGRISGRVPRSGRGFTVETHAGDFVDLGTEFGMIVSSDGAVQTHVFEGRIIAEPAKSGEAAPEPFVLQEGTAWTRSDGGDRQLAASPELFLRPTISENDSEFVPPPVDRDLVLWFDAAARIQRDHNGNVSAWGDQATASNEVLQNAWQVIDVKRPRWVADSIAGRPALRFDGSQGLVTEPLSLGSNQTSVVVFRFDPGAARELITARTEFQHLGVQLLNLNGPPHVVMQLNADGRMESRVHLGWLRDRPNPVDVGLLSSEGPLDEQVHAAIYTYNAEASVARLYMDGQMVSESNKVLPLGSTHSPRFLGSHYDREGFGFTGDIAEILVFNTALSAEESHAVSKWLAMKYNIFDTQLSQREAFAN